MYHIFHLFSHFRSVQIMAAEMTTNYPVDIPAMNATAMGPGNISVQWIGNDTADFNQTGSSFSVTPSGFPRVQAYMYITLALVGVINNSFALWVLKHLPTKAFFTYIKGLASVDLIFVCCVGIFVSYMWDGYVSSFAHCFLICRISSQLLWVCSKASTTITALVGVERVVSILSPFTMLRLGSTMRIRCVLVVAVVVAVVAQTGLMLMFRPTPYGDHYFCFWTPTFFTPLGQTLILANTIIFEYSMPILLFLCNIILITQLGVARVRRHKLQEGVERSTQPLSSSAADHRLTLMLICASILCLISNTPGTLLRLLAQEIPRDVYGHLRLFSDFMVVFERTAHFYMYIAVNEDFRATAKALLFCKPLPKIMNSSSTKVVSHTSSKKGSVSKTSSIDNPALDICEWKKSGNLSKHSSGNQTFLQTQYNSDFWKWQKRCLWHGICSIIRKTGFTTVKPVLPP